MLKHCQFVFIVVCLLILPNGTFAEEAIPAEQLPDLIQQRYEKLKTFSADFEQELTNISSGETELRKGRIWFQQPSQVRWRTDEPEKAVLILGPEFAWDYIEDEQMAIKYKVESILSSKTVLRFISGKANIKQDFNIHTEWEGRAAVQEKWGKDFTILKLVPKEAEPGMVLAYVGVEPATGLLRQVMVVDFYGNGNELRLSNVEQDIDIPADMFTFTPPEGVEVEDNTAY